MKPNTLVITALAAALSSTALHAQTTAWGSSIVPNPVGYFSNGTAISEAVPVQLGWFADGFLPTAANITDWAAHWIPVDTGKQEDFGGYYGVSDEYSSPTEFAPEMGKQAYIFAYNDLAILGQPGTEALLIRENGLKFPALLLQDTFDIADNLLNAKDDDFTVIFGRVDRNMYSLGGVIQGGGEFSNLLPDATNEQWEFQLGGIYAIPEPSAAMLGVIGALALLRRRR